MRPDVRGLPPVQRPAGQRMLLGLGQAEPVEPHPRQVGAPHAAVGRAEHGVLAGHHQIGAEREVAPSAHAPAVHLGDHGLRRAPNAHELLRRRHLGRGGHGEVLARVPPAIGLETLGPVVKAAPEVIPGTERAARPANHDHLHRRVAYRPAHRRLHLVGHRRHDRVQLFRAVEGDGGHRAVDGVEQRLVAHVAVHEAMLLLSAFGPPSAFPPPWRSAVPSSRAPWPGRSAPRTTASGCKDRPSKKCRGLSVALEGGREVRRHRDLARLGVELDIHIHLVARGHARARRGSRR